MKGTDVTEQQIQNAAKFLKAGGNWPAAERFVMQRDQLTKLLAWYAAVRGNGDGSGTFTSKRFPDGVGKP